MNSISGHNSFDGGKTIRKDYDNPFSRNIGLITQQQQESLSRATVLICGVGGMGGVCGEVLVRLGVGNLIIADHDCFELNNLNRQIHANQETIGRNKAEVLAEEFKKINPNLQITIVTAGVTAENVAGILDPSDVVVNGMDNMRSSLILERRARAAGKPIVDAWLTPYASVFVMKGDSPHWENYLQLPTLGVNTADLTPELCRTAVKKEVSYTFSYGEPYKHIDRETVQKVAEDRIPRPSLAPVVWLSGVMMANEAFKLLIGLPTTNHIGIIYDQYEHRLLLREKFRE